MALVSPQPTLSDQPLLTAGALPSLFTLADEVETLRHAARAFARNDLAPVALKLDLADAADFDWGIVEKGHDAGLLRVVIPREYGGLGQGVLATAVAMEEIAAVDPSTALIFGATLLAQTAVLLGGDPRLSARFLPSFAGDTPVLAANAITEEVAGSDLLIQENLPIAQDVASARPDGDHFVINGIKRFITNGKVADWACVYANVEGYPGATGLTAFIVPLDLWGVARGEVADKMGYRACLGTTLTFTDVRVPVENVIGGVANGGHIIQLQTNQARVSVAALSTGVAQGALDIAKRWVAARVQGGIPLWKHQFSARKLAEMSAKVEASRLLYLQAAYQADNLLPGPTYGPAIAKLYADQIAMEVSNEAMSLMGARGYCREYGLEKLVRDSFGARIYEGTPEILALDIARELFQHTLDEA